MVDFNNRKEVKRKKTPESRIVISNMDPRKYYSEKPAWSFADIDDECWAFTKEHIGDKFWDEILPRLSNLETQKWGEILIEGKKENHSIEISELNKIAKDRLIKIGFDDPLISLRVNGTHRLYGRIEGRVYHIMWFDDNHGDNDKCVCRSNKKHT